MDASSQCSRPKSNTYLTKKEGVSDEEGKKSTKRDHLNDGKFCYASRIEIVREVSRRLDLSLSSRWNTSRGGIDDDIPVGSSLFIKMEY